MYQLTNVDDNVVYIEGTAEEILGALLMANVKMFDTDGSRLHVRLA